MSQLSLASLLRSRSIVVVLYTLVAAYVFGVWVWSADTPTTSFNGDPVSELSDILYGTAHKPYVQRVLVPLLTRAVHTTVSGPTLDTLEHHVLQIPKVRKETLRLGWETEFFVEYVIALAFAFLSLLAFPYVVRSLWLMLYHTGQEITNVVPLIALLTLPPFFPTGPHYIYDFPTLLLFTLGLALLLRGRWPLFYPVYLVACLNKETTIMLTVLFLLLYARTLPTPRLLAHAGLQAFIFGIIKMMTAIQFAENGGNVIDFHLYLNIHIGLMGYGLTSLLVTALVLWLVFCEFSGKHPALRTSLLLAVPFGLLLLWGGVITELRDVYELHPVVLLLALHTVFFRLLKMPYSIRPLPSLPSLVA